MILEQATRCQQRASNPLSHVWVSASAGSGKTKVLIDRVLNLMLSKVSPESILCLTFTKAAAAEMENRLYERLSKWVLAADSELREELSTLLNRAALAEDLVFARRLFSAAIDAPGGLKIQTIHGFCQALLKRFPLEAGLSPYFNVIDDAKSMEILHKATNVLFENEDLEDTLSHLGRLLSPQKFQKLCLSLVEMREEVSRFPCDLRVFYKTVFGIDPFLKPESFIESFFEDAPQGALRSAIEVLCRGTKTDQVRAEAIQTWINTGQDIDAYCSCFLTAKGEPRQKLMTKALDEEFPHIRLVLENESKRILKFKDTLRTLDVALNSYHLARFARDLVRTYEDEKTSLAALDYQDLILKASHLLNTSSCSAWVLYKLDGGIQNILIDEAQDTSPEQWEIVKALTDEFFADGDEERTLFVVGDDKQSIYSFQGADPHVFSKMQTYFRSQSEKGQRAWSSVDLEVSFRSTPEVLFAVDAVFQDDRARQGVTKSHVQHLPFRADSPGHVELWPLVVPTQPKETDQWPLPQVGEDETPPSTRLAYLIAKTIRQWINDKKVIKGRPLSPGDIMVLVRKRSHFVAHLISALKREGVPVAGVDRMILLEQLPVQDLLKLAEFTLLPQDDLTLATVLKGPLFNLSEEALFRLAHDRGEMSLWQALKMYSEHESLVQVLEGLIDSSQKLSPYHFFAYVLGPIGGRRLWQKRMGVEVLDALDEFLNLTLTYEKDHISNLQLFLKWIYDDQTELKRDLEQSDEVRVMTVHGSKGLQAPIVILPDTTQVPQDVSDVLWEQGACVWMPPLSEDIHLTKCLRLKSQESQYEEYRRLLYVALTRAEDQLFICGAKVNPHDLDDMCWYELVRRGLSTCAESADFDFTDVLPDEGWSGKGYILTSSHKAKLDDQPEPSFEDEAILPAWLHTPLPPDPCPTRPLTPSQLGDKTPLSYLAPDAQGFGLQRGRIMHKLLEMLPQLPEEKRDRGCHHYLKDQPLPHKVKIQIADDCMRILHDYPHLFSEQSQAEVSVVGLVGSYSLSGQIDRLVVKDEEIHIIDYKTNVSPPEDGGQIPESYLRQMAAYKAALQVIYPQHTILCRLLWTALPRLDTIPNDLIAPYLADPSADALAA